MSVQSTRNISRVIAIARIKDIHGMIQKKYYRTIEALSFEPNEDIVEFVKDNLNMDISSIEQWTNSMLEEVLDRPFFRWSMFNNYTIKENE